MNRYFLIASALVFAACGPTPPKADGGTGGGGGMMGDCFEDADCPNTSFFFCNTTTSKCEPSCRAKTDCNPDVRGQYALDFCDNTNGKRGCECDEGKCVGSLCSADSDCGTQVCRNGACVAPPAASSVSTCAVIPDYVILKQGEKAKFWVSAWDSSKNPVIVNAGITWTAATAAVTIPASSTGGTVEATGGTPNTMAEQALKATIGGKDCFAKVLVVSNAAPAANTIDVTVTDELSGRPVAGASVLASVSATGVAIGAAVVTDAKGFANVPGLTGNTSVTVSVFHADYNYLTVANYDMTGSRSLSFVVRRNQVDKYGGYKGTFKNVPATSNVHAGIAGASLAGSITDLSFAQLLGPTVPTRVKIGTAIDQMNVPLPAGIYLGFTDQVIKGNISGQGLAGTCVTAAGVPDEAAILAGTCGTRTAWALAGDVPLGDLPIDAVAGGLNNIDFGKILSRIIPIFKKFNSSVVRDVQFNLVTTPKDAAGKYVFSEPDGGLSHFTSADHNFYQTGVATTSEVPLAFNLVAKVPDLPKFRNTYVDAAVLLGGAIVPGRGVVPLGLGAAVNTTPADAKTDPQSELVTPGLVTLRMSPTHHGIEGAEYGIVALGVSAKSITDASAGLATSAIFSRVTGNALKFDPKGMTPVDLGPSFPGFPESAKYNYTDTAGGGVNARSFLFANATESSSAGSSVVRVVFTDEAEHRWVVYLNPAAATTGFTLPKPPGTFGDRTFFNNMSTGTRSPFLVQQIRLNDNPASATGAAITFNKLVELNSTNGDRVVDFLTGFSLVDYDRPSITWKTPKDPGTAVVKGMPVVVTVKAFKVGMALPDDGYVRLSITPANANCPDVDVKTDASMGKGDISITIPANCVQANATMTATLMTFANTPVLPPVSSALTANIQ